MATPVASRHKPPTPTTATGSSSPRSPRTGTCPARTRGTTPPPRPTTPTGSRPRSPLAAAPATLIPRTVSYGYDDNGNQTTVKDARNFTTTTSYNADDKATLVTNADSNSTLTCYDGDANAAQNPACTSDGKRIISVNMGAT